MPSSITKMPSSLLLLLLLLLPLAAVSSPFNHYLRLRSSDPQEYFEVNRPLVSDSLTPSCTLPLLSYTFANTLDLPPTNSTYSPPTDCTWSHAVLHLSGESNGTQLDRIAAVWLAGIEILRTSTPQPTPDGIFWNIKKDITKYSSVLKQSNVTLSVILQNVVTDVYTAAYTVNLTALFYSGSSNDAVTFPLSLLPSDRKSTTRKLGEKKQRAGTERIQLKSSLDLNENPADLIIPISSSGDEGFWFKIQNELDSVFQGIQIPLNTYRAVIELYVSFHGDDEYWYSNPPDYYIEMNGLETKRGHGSYREVLVKIDDNVVGSVMPFPVIYGGGINPSFWKPIAAIGAFDLPSYEIEITPFLAVLLDNKTHYFGLGVADAISFWLIDANLHLWLDPQLDRVEAGAIKYTTDPSTSIEREFKFQQLDGKFEVEGESEVEFSGWVSSSLGNFTTVVSRKMEFENSVKFEKNGTKKEVEHEVEFSTTVEIKSSVTGNRVSKTKISNEYPLEMSSTLKEGTGIDNYLVNTELEVSLSVEQEDEQSGLGTAKSTLKNKQKCKGWEFVQGSNVLSSSGSTEQTYEVKDSVGCYKRQVSAEAGAITDDVENFLCSVIPPE